MCACGPDNVSVDENIPLDFVRDICLNQGVSFGGNMQLTTVLLLGGPDDARRNALACMDIGGAHGYLLAPGCDLAYATPPANLEAVGTLVRDPYAQEVTRTLAHECVCGENTLDMSAYGTSDKVVVDVITLDSEACAPCQYMVEAVKAVAPQFEQLVEWREHKIKYRESLVFMTALMVRNVPTICIDGQITFVSRIPPRDELIAAIQKRIFEKLRIKIQRRRATLTVLGGDCDSSKEAECRCRRAVMELGAAVEVQRIDDPAAWRDYGIVPAQTPAIVLSRQQVKTVNTIPEVGIIKEWIKDLD
jgi:uroporphyrinogen decarboxylase